MTTNPVSTAASLGFRPFGLTFQWLVISKFVYPNSPLVARVIDTTSGQLSRRLDNQGRKRRRVHQYLPDFLLEYEASKCMELRRCTIVLAKCPPSLTQDFRVTEAGVTPLSTLGNRGMETHVNVSGCKRGVGSQTPRQRQR